MLSGLAPVMTVPSGFNVFRSTIVERVRAAVAREPAPEVGRDGEAVHAVGIGDLADDLAGLGVGDDDLRRM